MHILITVLVCFFAGMGAGLGTGFAGMSAAAVISPMLITFLGMDPYLAVGIALSSDVLASAVSAYTYGKNKNLDIRNGLIMMASVLAFTVVGSYIASIVPSATMGSFSVVMTFLLGVKFIVRPVMTTKEAMQSVSAKKRAVQSVVCGVIIGFICGFIGAGGGMMMLLILTSVLGYELKTAVGTSVFIMTFTALTGAVSHFAIGGAPDWTVFALCVVFTLLWARIAAVFAMILSFCPKFEAIINTIPSGIIGGISFVLYGMISAIGVRNVVENKVDFTNSRNLIIAAVILVCALGFNSVGGITFAIAGVNINLSGLAIAAIAGILLNAILPGNDYEFDEGSNEPESASLRV